MTQNIFVTLFIATLALTTSADIVISKVDPSSTEQINKHGVCKDVTNSTAHMLMVPTRTATEWTNFRNNLPPGVTLADCDLCPGVSAIGGICPNGAKYLGTYNYGGSIGTKKLLITPGGCTNSVNPTCMNTLDTQSRIWTASVVSSGASSTSDGLDNTNKMLAHESTSPTAKYCTDMIFAGLTDWYVPARDELIHIYTNRNALAASSFRGFGGDFLFYWSSTESGGSAFAKNLDDGSESQYGKGNSNYIRCILRY